MDSERTDGPTSLILLRFASLEMYTRASIILKPLVAAATQGIVAMYGTNTTLDKTSRDEWKPLLLSPATCEALQAGKKARAETSPKDRNIAGEAVAASKGRNYVLSDLVFPQLLLPNPLLLCRVLMRLRQAWSVMRLWLRRCP